MIVGERYDKRIANPPTRAAGGYRSFGVMVFASAASAGAPGDRRASVCSGRLSGLLSKGVLDLRMIDAGTYDVKFNKTINRCVKVATLGSCFPGVVSGPGEIVVATSPVGGDTVQSVVSLPLASFFGATSISTSIATDRPGRHGAFMGADVGIKRGTHHG